MIELYRAENRSRTSYHFFYYTVYINGKPIFEIELSDHREIHIISDGSVFNMGVKNYRKVDFEKSDLKKYHNPRQIISQYFRRIGEND